MGFASWFKNTTFQGRIIRRVGSVRMAKGLAHSTTIHVEELTPSKHTGDRRFRLNVVSKAALAYQSLPLLIGEEQIQELRALLTAALEAKRESDGRESVRASTFS